MIATDPRAQDVEVPTPDGLRLQGRLWSRPDAVGAIIVAHGFGEHGGTYERLAQTIVRKVGLDVLAADLRGHGRSPGRRGIVGRYEELVSDYQSALRWASRRSPGLPLFALGHSNGGQVALRAALQGEGRPPLAGVIASNPMLRLSFPVPKGKLALARLLLRFAPGVTLGAPIEPEKLSRDPAMAAFYTDDPLRHGRISAPLFFGMVDGGERLLNEVGALELPTLMIVGGADPIVDPGAARIAFDRIAAPDKTLLLYPDALHEPFHDKGREGVIADLIAWLHARLSPTRG